MAAPAVVAAASFKKLFREIFFMVRFSFFCVVF